MDESTYFAGTLAYVFEDPDIKEHISSVFFQVNTGHIPPETDNSTNFIVGVEVPAGDLLEMLIKSRE